MQPFRTVSFMCKPGKFGQWIAVVIVSQCAMTVSLSSYWSLGALGKIEDGEAGFTLDLKQQSLAVSSLFVGNVISPVPSAYLMETLGCRRSLSLFIWLQVASFLLMAFVKGFWPVCIGRLLQGLWVGLVYTAVPVYVGECSDPSVRGSLGTFFGTFFYIGSTIISVLGSYSSYFMLCLIPAVITGALGVSLIFVPESPYYFASKGDVENARSSITWLRGFSDETFLSSVEESVKKSRMQNSSYLDVLRSASARKALSIVLILCTVQRGSGLSVLLTYGSVTLPDCILSAEKFMIVLNVLWAVSCIASSCVVDRFDRRTLMGISSLGSFITMFGVATWYFLRDEMGVDVTTVLWLPSVLLIFQGVSFSLGILPVPTMMPGEIFPVDVKSRAASLVSAWTASVSALVVYIFLPVEAAAGVYVNFLICSVSSFFGIFTAVFIMIETRGRSLLMLQTPSLLCPSIASQTSWIDHDKSMQMS